MMEDRTEDGSTFGRLFEEIAGPVWEDALRFALDIESASERCGRRSCRKTGMCQLKWTEGKPLSCGGVKVSFETVRIASIAMCFGTLMVMRCLHAPALPPPGLKPPRRTARAAAGTAL